MRDPHIDYVRHEYQVTRWNGDLRRQTRTLGSQRVLDNLYGNFLPFTQQLADIGIIVTPGVALRISRTGIRRMQKCCPLQPDIDKGSLHPGQYPANLATKNLADDAAALGAFDKDFLQHPVFNHRNPGLPRRYINQYLFAHISLSVNISL